MAELIGVAHGHEERLVADNPEYALFFEQLRAEGRRTEALGGELTVERLAECSALLIGEPHDDLAHEELRAIREWVFNGGQLLAVVSMRGYMESNIDELLGLKLDDHVLGIDHGLADGRPFDTKVQIDVSSLVGRHAVLCYDTGTAFTGPASFDATHDIAVPQGSSVIPGLQLKEGEPSEWHESPHLPERGSRVFVSYADGAGRVIFLGSSWVFRDDTIIRDDNLLFTNWLFSHWLPRLTAQELGRRKRRPQRHRLLHGYPMAPLMRDFDAGDDQQLPRLAAGVAPAVNRPLIVGVLPHPFCNPQVKGCGFCTFPHEVFSKGAARITTANVAREVVQLLSAYPELAGRRVESLYIGGGTANLAPADELARVCTALASGFDVAGIEATLEGVPRYFQTRDLLAIISECLGSDRIRLSMGIQTFAEAQLRRMGRTAFGDANTVAEVAAMAHRRGYTVSGDLLFNLPGQTRGEMTDDVDRAMSIGPDHICLYHLVMFEGLGTEWSRDEEMLAALPTNDRGCSNFLELRERLIAGGYQQRTLTNFELAEHAGTPREFLYERAVMCPEAFDWLGFGPSGISLISDASFRRALKLVNEEKSTDYDRSIDSGQKRWRKYFALAPHDMKILYLTRKIARLGFERSAYCELFGVDVTVDFASELDALQTDQLIELDDTRFSLTPRGMFYADTVAGLLAWRQVAYYRALDHAAGTTPSAERYYYGREVDRNSWMG